jgi:hypothetical protein
MNIDQKSEFEDIDFESLELIYGGINHQQTDIWMPEIPEKPTTDEIY